MSISLSLGLLLEKYNPTAHGQYHVFNKFCLIFVAIILSINLFYYLIAILTLYFHMVKQLYKLARGTILSSSATLLE